VTTKKVARKLRGQLLFGGGGGGSFRLAPALGPITYCYTVYCYCFVISAMEVMFYTASVCLSVCLSLFVSLLFSLYATFVVNKLLYNKK